MHGNVYEWCQDWYGAYPVGSATDPQGLSLSSNRVIRGGSWNYIADDSRGANRFGDFPGSTDNGIGFRAVLARGQP